MRNLKWKQLALSLLSGAVLFQAPGCTDAALVITTATSVITASGVTYLVWRVID